MRSKKLGSEGIGRHRKRVALLLTGCLALAVGACGGDDDDSVESTTPPTDAAAAPPTNAATTPTEPGDGAVSSTVADDTTSTSPEGSGSSGTLPESADQAAIAAYDGADREEVLLAGACEEGKLVFYTSFTSYEDLVAAFTEKYPCVEVEALQSGDALSTRIAQEYAAGRHNFDVYLDLRYKWQRTGDYFAPYVPVGGPRELREGFEDSEFEAISHSYYIGFAYNTDQVTEDEAPQAWTDLTDPKYAGQLLVGSGSNDPTLVTGVLGEEFGREFLEALAPNVVPVDVGGGVANQQVAEGQYPYALVALSSRGARFAEEGLPFRWQPMEPTVAMVSSVSLAKEAPHPYAATLFQDWLLDPDGGGAVFTSLGNETPQVGQDDILTPYIDSLDGITVIDPTTRSTLAEDLTGWQEQREEVFGW